MWIQRIQLALQEGQFDSDNDTKLDWWHANNWKTCAVSEAPGLDLAADGSPVDPTKTDLGRQFYRAVKGNKPDVALELYRKIVG
jgi:hypothetical protein